MRYDLSKFGKMLFLALALVSLAAAPSFAVVKNLAVVQAEWTPPGGGPPIPMWAFVEDTGACPAGAVPWNVGPKITVPSTDATLQINLRNCLPAGSEPVSIVIPGQAMPAGGAAPVWNDGSSGPRTNPAQRVRSFSHETLPGATGSYTWNGFEAGTYLYESGTHPQVQVQMGLYGAATRNSDDAAPQAYPGIDFGAEVDLFFSEIDPVLHGNVAGGTFAGSTLEYRPKYFLLHRYDSTAGSWVDATIDTGTIPPPCIDAGTNAGERTLLRLYNAGLRELAPMLLGAHMDLVAEGGKPYPFARTQYQTLLVPGSTNDAIFAPEYGGTFNLIERRLNLTDGTATGGGMQTCFNVAAGLPTVVHYFSTAGNTAVPGVAGPYDDADIYSFASGNVFSRIFDASANGLPGNADIDGLVIVDADTFYLSFSRNAGTNIPGIGTVQDEDVVLYNAGTWSLFFDGSAACGLGGSNAQDLDAIDVVGGVLYFSTVDGGAVAGVSAPYDDADIYSWNGSACSRLFDASANGLAGAADIDGLTVVDANTFYVSFKGDGTNVPVIGPVQNEDIVHFEAGTWSLFFGGSAFALDDLDAIDIP